MAFIVDTHLAWL